MEAQRLSMSHLVSMSSHLHFIHSLWDSKRHKPPAEPRLHPLVGLVLTKATDVENRHHLVRSSRFLFHFFAGLCQHISF